jgi:hypothetical protein
MPFKSEAQRRLFHVKADKGEIPQATVSEWEHATKNKAKLPMHVAKKAYEQGKEAALRKLGFINSLDPEDLPNFLAKTKRRQLHRLYNLNAATGFPAGGLIGERPHDL